MPKSLDFYSFSNKGYTGQVIHIESDVRTGFPGFDIIGLPDAAIKESRERVRTALRNCGFKFPTQKVLVSLSPASVPKSGSLLDLGIALSILFASQGGKKNQNNTEGNAFPESEEERTDEAIKIMAAGELSLDGTIIEDYSVIGAIEAAKKTGCELCLIPYSSPNESGVIKVSTLTEAFLKSGEILNLEHGKLVPFSTNFIGNSPIFSDIIGLEKEKEILTISAAGRHSLLLFGPPGVGKTLLTTRLPLLLPNLDDKTLSEVQHIHGCAGLAKNDSRPTVRMISHDSSKIQFTQGGEPKSPGDGALAHRGVIILDEITSYSKKLLETIKETYDVGLTTSSRCGELVVFPASFLMTGSMNACACGKLGSPNEACMCTSHKIIAHWDKVGTPLLSRFDIRLPVEAQNIGEHIFEGMKSDSYYTDKVALAAERQHRRFKDYERIKYNGDSHISGFNALSVFKREIELYHDKFQKNRSFNMREIISIVSLARTIADTNDKDSVTEEDIELSLSLKRYGTGDYFWKTLR